MSYEAEARYYKALSDPIRLKILDFLRKNGRRCICEIAKDAKREQSVVFRHILILKDAGLVATKKEKKYLMCNVK